VSIRNGSSYTVTYPVLGTIRMELLQNGGKTFMKPHSDCFNSAISSGTL
jgi:hypothetical protein